MYSLLRSKSEAPTETEIEDNLAGNLWYISSLCPVQSKHICTGMCVVWCVTCQASVPGLSPSAVTLLSLLSRAVCG